MGVFYRHVQTGYLMIAFLGIPGIAAAIAMINLGYNLPLLIVALALLFTLLLFHSLTVTIEDGFLKISFGIGIIKAKFSLDEIESHQPVKNSWLYGWGIRLTPHGVLYNVSGLDAVEIKMKSGKRYRIGTDAPEELDRAIEQAIGMKYPH